MTLSTANLSATASFVKRATEKSSWSGQVADDVSIKIDDGVWYITRDGKDFELADRPTREGMLEFMLRQVLADSYAGADDLTDARKRFNKKLDNIIDGSWGADSRGPGVNEWLYEARNIIRAEMKKDNPKEYKRFNKQDAKVQNAELDRRVAAAVAEGDDNAKAKKLFDRKVEMRMVAAEEARKAKRDLAAKLAMLDEMELEDDEEIENIDEKDETEEE